MGITNLIWTVGVPLAIIIFLGSGIRIVRPIEVGLIERLGKYRKTATQGFSWIIPVIETMRKVNMTERMVDVQPQTVITRDKLNAVVDAVVYYQIKEAKASQYNVDDHQRQLSSLARTTLRAVVGKMSLTEANEKRSDINTKVEEVLEKETDSYGVKVLRVELQKIEPPEDVQVSMNEVVKAEQEKIAARDLATATETKADGVRRADIKKAQGVKQSKILEAQGEAAAIKSVHEAAQQYFKNEAQDLKKLETTEKALKSGTKYIIDTTKDLSMVVSEVAGVTPIKKKKEKEE